MRTLVVLISMQVLAIGHLQAEVLSDLSTCTPDNCDLSCTGSQFSHEDGPPEFLAEPIPARYFWCAKKGHPETAHGSFISWYDNDQVMFRGSYANGKKTGLWTFWYESGDLFRTGSYKKGIRHGKWLTQYKTGVSLVEGEYVDGVPVGIWTFRHETGQRAEEGGYTQGHRHGMWTLWHDNGFMAGEGGYWFGRLCGIWVCLDISGAVTSCPDHFSTVDTCTPMDTGARCTPCTEEDFPKPNEQLQAQTLFDLQCRWALKTKDDMTILTDCLEVIQWSNHYLAAVNVAKLYERFGQRGKALHYYQLAFVSAPSSVRDSIQQKIKELSVDAPEFKTK